MPISIVETCWNNVKNAYMSVMEAKVVALKNKIVAFISF